MYVSTSDCCKEHNLKPLYKIIRARVWSVARERVLLSLLNITYVKNNLKKMRDGPIMS